MGQGRGGACWPRGAAAEGRRSRCWSSPVSTHDRRRCCRRLRRDIKPENFLLTTERDDAALEACDFGLSAYFKPGQRFSQLIGSAYYVAPEVLGRSYSHECDLWSLGVVLYILLSGGAPPLGAGLYFSVGAGIAEAG